MGSTGLDYERITPLTEQEKRAKQKISGPSEKTRQLLRNKRKKR